MLLDEASFEEYDMFVTHRAAAFSFATPGGLLFAKFMNLFLPEGEKINPLIGNAGVIGSAIAAGILLSYLG